MIEDVRMAPQQMASLLDTAMSMPVPLAYLDSAVSLFGLIGRHHDAQLAAVITCLLVEEEIEILMDLRAAWRRGEARNPAGVGSISGVMFT